MSSDTSSTNLDRALVALQKLRRRVDELEQASREPIAIVGAACRLPSHISTPDELWSALRAGVDAVKEVPKDRWEGDAFASLDPSSPAAGGRRFGAFLEGVDRFDPAFFGISRREAERMDPQQRLFLQVCADALEDAGIPTRSLAGSQTGVFAGVYNTDFRDLVLGDPPSIDSHAVTGTCHAVLAGRVSYALDLRGPSIVVDTACSSSLLAVHLACQSLRQRESEVALAGGVNVILSPTSSLLTSKLFALSPDGRCRTFDAGANGFVRGEGCGVVVLKRLSDALRDGDAIRAVIRGSAMNQDGRSAGLTAPNGRAQEAVVRAALAAANMKPECVGYIEAHGTGTPLGDPIEMDALKAIYGAPREDGSRCAVGTIKTNLGHLEAAAGIAGLLRAMLCIERGEVPPHLHLRTLNPRISLADTPLFVSTSALPWPGPAGVRCAAVSSFGVSGTNVHLVLEAAPTTTAPALEGAADKPHVLPISARSAEALRTLLERWRARLTEGAPAPTMASLASAAASRRNVYEHRSAVVGSDAAQWIASIDEQLAHRSAAAGAAPARSARRKVAFVFPGQGSQWLGMGRRLAVEEPVFAEALARADAAVRAVAGWSVRDELAATEARSRLSETQFAQPVLFAVQIALAALWRSWGIEPDAVVGHSMGEIAAAHVAGALDLAAAARIIVVRSELVKKRRGHGGMAQVELDLPAAEAAIAAVSDRLSVAASNGPRTTIVSGAREPLERLVADLERRGVFARLVKVDYASHSPEMDELLPELREKLSGLAPRAGTVPIYSTLRGRVEDGSSFDASYWVDNLRQPVLFAKMVERLARDGHEIFIEQSAHPVLVPAIEQTLDDRGSRLVLASLRRERDDRRSMLESLAAIFEYGHPVDLARVEPRAPFRERLPLTPRDDAALPVIRHEGRAPRGPGRGRGHHPLWGTASALVEPASARLYETNLSSSRPAFLGEHRVQGAVVVPASAFVELALVAAKERSPDRPLRIDDLELLTPLALADERITPVQAVVEWDGGERASDERARGVLTIASGDTESSFTVHVRARLAAAARSTEVPPADLAAIYRRCTEERAAGAHLKALAARGLEYGPAFRGIERIWASGGGEAIARVGWTDRAREDGELYVLHPVVLDACLQVLAAAMPASEGTWLPASIGRLSLRERPEPNQPLVVHAEVEPADVAASRRTGRLTLHHEDGRVLVELERVTIAKLEEREARSSELDILYELVWEPKSLAVGDRPRIARGRWLVLADDGGRGEKLARLLAASGASVMLARRGNVFRVTGDEAEIDPTSADDYGRLVAAAFEGHEAGGIVHLFDLDVPISEEREREPTIGNLRDAQLLGAGSVLLLAKALAAAALRLPPRLWLVTHGAIRTGEEGPVGVGVGVAQAPVWGLGRTIAMEHPELRATMIDLPPDVDDHAVAALAEELAEASAEGQVALRPGARHVARLSRARRDTVTATAAARGRPFALEIGAPGTFDELALSEVARPAPGPGEVEIEVYAAGLNFLDILTALGVRPDRPRAVRARLGGECAGVVTRVGPGVVRVAVGDEVVALAEGSIASFVRTKEFLTTPKPAHVDFAASAALPLAYMTAWHALVELGRLDRGESVLVHAASGGVGLAAIAVAHARGATVYGTAGTAEKRALVRRLGAAHVMDSRSLAFGEELRAFTAGRGVDVVLNCLTGPAVDEGLGVLAPYGRFIEIAKKDIYENKKVGLFPFRQNLSYAAVDLARMMVERPERMGRLLEEVVRHVCTGALPPLETTTFVVGDALSAFRLMAEAKHVGKIAIVVKGEDPLVRARAAVLSETGELANPSGTILVTGGLGGIGIEIARWLVARGARDIVLAGRHTPDVRAAQAITELGESGARVESIALDVGDEVAVDRWVRALEPECRRLSGVVHAAAVLDDGVLSNQDVERLRRVLRPKLDGAWNLHRATCDRPLDFFVMLSSAASLLGSAAQAPYAAANAFLDALAHHRRSLGLHAVSISYGPWANVGLAAADDKRGRRLGQMGMGSLSCADGLEVLASALGGDGPVHVAALPLDVRQWLEANPSAAGSPLWARLRERAAAMPTTRGTLVDELADASDAARHARLVVHVREQLARVLRLPVEKISDGSTFGPLGLDSLTGLEMRNRLENALGLRLSATLLWTYTTPAALATRLLADLGLGAKDAGEPPRARPAPPSALAEADAEAARLGSEHALTELSEQELTRQLEAELDSLRAARTS